MNIVLIGMPGCGKSTVGALVAEALNRPFVETDALIEQGEKTSIGDIFALKGEAGFRDLETAAVRRAARLDGAVISTGGGVILRAGNMQALEKRGIICFLSRPPEELAEENHANRPLLAGDSRRVFDLYRERIGLYQKYARHTIRSQKTPCETAGLVLKALKEEGIT